MRHSMMLPNLIKISIVIFAIFIGATECGGADSVGCKSINSTASQRAFRVNPGALGGSANPTAVNPADCMAQCSEVPTKPKFNYAGVHASLCFCGYDLPNENVTGCTETCASASECRSVTWNSQLMLYSIAPTSVVQTKIHLGVSADASGPNDEQAVQDFMSVAISADATGQTMGRFVDHDPYLASGASPDSVVLESPMPSTFSAVLPRPTFSMSRYLLHGVSHSGHDQLHATRIVKTYQRLEGVELDVNYNGNQFGAVPIGVKVDVVASIKLGTNQSAVLDFGNGQSSTLNNMIEPMARTFRKLSAKQYEGNGTLRTRIASSSSPLIILREYDFKQPTTLTQVQFHTFLVSSFQIEVIQYRPMCSNVTMYCYYRNSCILRTSKCQGTTRASACSGGSRWSFVAAACVNNDTLQVTRSVAPFFAGSYQLVKGVNITAKTGLNLVNLNSSNYLEVLPGDIVGIRDSSVGLSEKAGPTSDVVNAADVGGLLTISPALGPSGDLAVQLFGYRQSQLSLSTVYNDSFCSNESALICNVDRNYTITLIIGNSTPVAKTVTVQIPVSGAVMVANTLLSRSGVPIEFEVQNHAGSRPTYACDFSDGIPIMQSGSKTFSHVYQVDGSYQAKCTAINLISTQAIPSLTIEIEHPLNKNNVTVDCNSTLALLPASEGSPSDSSVSTNFHFNYTGNSSFIPRNANLDYYIINVANVSTRISWTQSKPTHFERRSFTYGKYDIYGTLWNRVSNFSFQCQVTVQERIINPRLVPESRIGLTNQIMTFNFSVDWGSDYQLELFFGDGSAENLTINGRQREVQVNHTYLTSSNFTVTARVTNRVSSHTITLEGTAVEILLVPFGFAISALSVGLIDMRSSNITHPNFILCASPNYTSQPNLYLGDVSIDKGDSSPVVGPHRLTSCAAGTSAQHASCSSIDPSLIFCYLFPPQTYTWTGNFTASVTVSKPIGQQEIKHNISIFALIVGLEVVAVPHPDVAADPRMSAWVPQRTFPKTRPVTFTANMRFGVGPGLKYSWDFGDGSNTESASNTVSHQYAKEGNYVIRVNASHVHSTASSSVNITVYRPVDKLEIGADLTASMMQPYEVFIDLGTLPAEACFIADFSAFGRNVEANQTAHMFGSDAACRTLSPVSSQYGKIYWDNQLSQEYSRLYQQSLISPVPTIVRFIKNFTYFDQKVVRLYGYNKYSMQETSFYMVVSRGPCSKPKLNLSYAMPDPQFSRDQLLVFNPYLSVNCYNNSVDVKWKIEKYDNGTSSWQDFMPTLKNFHQTYPSHVNYVVLDDKLISGVMYQGSNEQLKTFIVFPFAFNFHTVYRVTVQATMVEEPALNATDSIVVNIYKAPLRPCLSYRVYDQELFRWYTLKSPAQSKFGFEVEFDASCSVNPNKFILAGEFSDWDFEYYCNRECEGDLVFGPDGSYSFDNQPKNVCNKTTISGGIVQNLTCFTADPLRTKHHLSRVLRGDWNYSGGSGKMDYIYDNPVFKRWKDDAMAKKQYRYLYYMPTQRSDSPLVLNTHTTFEKETHKIYVVVRDKNDPLMQPQITMVVATFTLGMPPIITDICISNCKKSVVPIRRLNGKPCEDKAININTNIPIKFQTSIENYIPGVNFYFRWQISDLKSPVMSCPSDLSQSSVLAQLDNYESDPAHSEWSIIDGQNCASTGIFSPGLSIDGVGCLPRVSNGIYILRVKSYREGSKSNYGFKMLYLMINKAPDISLLSVRAFPNVGEALSTRFQFTCEGARDSDGPLKYNIGYSLLDSVNGPEDCIPIEIGAQECKLRQAVTLPGGPKKLDSNVTICVEVFDAEFSSSFFKTTSLVRVTERLMSIEEISKGSLNSIEGSAYGGNAREMGKSAFPAISSLNAARAESPTEVQEKIQFRRTVVNLISRCVNASDKNATAENRLRDLEFQSKMLNLITDAPEGELDEVAVQTATETCNTMAKNLLEISQQRDVSYNEVLSSVNRIIKSSESILVSTNNAVTESQRGSTSNRENLGSKQLNNYEYAASSLANKMVTDERRTHVSTGNISIVVVKRQPSNLKNAKLKASGSTECDSFKLGDFKDSSGNNVLMEQDPRNPNLTVPSQAALTKVIKSKSNLFASAKGGENMTSSTYSISVSSVSRGDYDISDLGPSSWIEMRLNNILGDNETVPSTFGRTTDRSTALQTQKILVDTSNALFVKVERFFNLTDARNETDIANLTGYGFLVYFKSGKAPTEDSYDQLCQLPLPPTTMCDAPSNVTDVSTTANTTSENKPEPCICRNNSSEWRCSPLAEYNETSLPTGPEWRIAKCICNSSLCLATSQLDSTDSCATSNSYQPNLWTCFLSVDDLNTRESEQTVYFGVRAIQRPIDGKQTLKNRDESDVVGQINSKNSKENGYQYLSIDFKSTAFTAGCFFFDTNASQFSNIGVHVGQCSTPTETQCFSSHMTSFMSSFYVPPLAFNPSDSAWLKLDSNPIALSVVLALVCFYIIVVVWVRKRDKDDLKRVGVTPLQDNHPADEFRYELTFWTGARRHAGTTAQVSFCLIGEESETEARPVFDTKRPVLQTGSVDSFYMTTPSNLGRLTHARIWHDNTGSDPKWYFSRMLVEDLQTGDKYFFICNRWFAFDEDDGMVDRVLPVSGMEEVRKFDVVFWSKAQKNLNDGHLWLSVVTRSPRSKFTRVQRATACLVLVMSTMMVNLMFYGQSKRVESPQLIEFGPIKLTAHSIYLATVSSLIILPINVLIVVLFKNRRNKPKSASKVKPRGPVTLDEESSQGSSEKYAVGDSTPDSGEVAERSIKSKIVARLRPLIRRVWPLPWWSYIIGYILSLLSVAACTYLMVEFGGVLGEEKTSEWLASMLVTLLQSIVLIQPVKIVVIAVVYALLVKKIDEDEDEVTKEMVAAGLPPVHERLTIKDLTDPSKREMFLKSKRAPPPPDEHILRELREQRIRENNMNDILKDIAFYILFLVVLMMAAYTSQDYRSYLQNNYVKKMMTNGIYVLNETHKAKTMSSAVRRESVWDYLNNTVVPTAYPVACYNGEYCNQVGLNWTADPNLMLVRMAQLRQLRIKKAVDKCKISAYFANIISTCRPEYSMLRDDERSFSPGWFLANATTPTLPEWSYTSALEMYGTPVSGSLSTYSGGGYVASLGRNRNEARAKVTSLADKGWLDLYTRAVFVEMLLYNPNTNLFTFCELLLEFYNGGAFFPEPMIFTLRLDRYVGANGVFYLALDIVALIFIVVFMIKEIRALHKKKCSYFQDAFNVMDFCLLLVSCAEIGLFATRIFAQKAVSYLLRTYPNKFVNFQWLILWQQMNQLFMGLIVFIFTVRFLRLLTFNRKMRMLGCVLHKAVKPLLHFGIVFGIMFFAFVQMGYLMFFRNVESFKTPIATVETLGVMTLNKFDFTTFIVGGGNLGMIFFFFYMLFVSFILINFFLTIILESFSAVKADWANDSNEYEIVDYTISCLKSLFGCKEAVNKLHHIDTRFNYMQETWDAEERLVELDGKLDQLELYICTAGIRINEKEAKAIKARLNREKMVFDGE